MELESLIVRMFCYQMADMSLQILFFPSLSKCGNMAREGLRTLVVAKKSLSEEQYQDFEVGRTLCPLHTMFSSSSPHNLTFSVSVFFHLLKILISSFISSWYRTATTRQSWAYMTEPWRLPRWWRAWRGRWSFSVWLAWKTSFKQMSDQHWSSSGTLELRWASLSL